MQKTCVKNEGLGNLKTKLFTLKTTKHVGFGGPWYLHITYIYIYIHIIFKVGPCRCIKKDVMQVLFVNSILMNTSCMAVPFFSKTTFNRYIGLFICPSFVSEKRIHIEDVVSCHVSTVVSDEHSRG